MAASVPLQTCFAGNIGKSTGSCIIRPKPEGSKSRLVSWNLMQKNRKKKSMAVVAAVGDVSPDGITYLFAGAATVALLGTAFPILFSRKDLCPECDGAGFIRKSGGALRANAARKDQAQIVCPNCNGLGKLNQIDKKT